MRSQLLGIGAVLLVAGLAVLWFALRSSGLGATAGESGLEIGDEIAREPRGEIVAPTRPGVWLPKT